jgi:hypothetical protein
MQVNDDHIKYPIPERYRASLDPADTAAYERLLIADETQKDLAEKIGLPTIETPGARARAKAEVRLQGLLQGFHADAGNDRKELVAETLATLGHYKQAAEYSTAHEDLYLKYLHAVERDDREWCAHPDQHKYTKERVFSLKHGCEMPLLACNRCGTWNVADEPAFLIEQRKARAAAREQARSSLTLGGGNRGR